MSTRWHLGAKQLRGPLTTYAKRFELLEVRAVLEEPGEPAAMPTLATLRRWRKSVPPHFQFAVVAGPHASRVRPGAELERELALARSVMDTLQARCFVLRTLPDVTPTTLWRERIGNIVKRIPTDVTSFVWEPSGVWEIADAAAQARNWGAVVAVDPMRDVVPPGPVAYLRLRALGETHAFSPQALERMVRAVGARRDVFAILETDGALAEAKRLRQFARAPQSAGAGGPGRLIRPRGAIVVTDDEQE